jgi:prolyl-tRNA synthetase
MRTRLFLRTAEFLWQEGHTAHATYEDAEEETVRMLGVYRRFAEEFMAVPVIEGRKTDKEKFAGADHTYSIEAMMGDGKALQAGTSHHLAQNFAKAFDVTFQTDKGTREYVYATSWGLSTRMIGALIMTHGDDNGIIIPPKLATTHVVVVPIFKPEERQVVMQAVDKFTSNFKKVGIGFKIDDREQYRPGFKFNEWEKRGVPLRIEVGPKDLEKNQVLLARRDNREKTPASQDGLDQTVLGMLDTIQKSLFNRAVEFREKHTYQIDDYKKFPEILDGEGGFIWSHWCGSGACEEQVKEETKATIRNIPRDSPAEEGKCIKCGGRSERRVIFARAY